MLSNEHWEAADPNGHRLRGDRNFSRPLDLWIFYKLASRKSPESPTSLILSGKSFLLATTLGVSSSTTFSSSTLSLNSGGRNVKLSSTLPLYIDYKNSLKTQLEAKRASLTNHVRSHTPDAKSRLQTSSILPPIGMGKTTIPVTSQVVSRQQLRRLGNEVNHLPSIFPDSAGCEGTNYHYSAKLSLLTGGGGQTSVCEHSSRLRDPLNTERQLQHEMNVLKTQSHSTKVS